MQIIFVACCVVLLDLMVPVVRSLILRKLIRLDDLLLFERGSSLLCRVEKLLFVFDLYLNRCVFCVHKSMILSLLIRSSFMFWMK